MSKPSVYIVDDQPSVCYALSEMLSVFGYSVQTFASAQAFLESCSGECSGCLVADVRMPGMDGMELMREVTRRAIPLPVILISGHADVPMAVAAIKAGALEFIEKPVDDKQLVAAINRAFADAFERLQSCQSLEALRARLARLTARESEVFDLVAQGHTSQAIATKLGISIRTVESYRVQIMDKMQAESVAALVRQAIKLGRIEP
ncbi:MAG: DNA-binding response regulator [Betaproteobacteria bacterium]|nr:MAG: DNA-binding response regulator [Betaproteobacteria bacterium]